MAQNEYYTGSRLTYQRTPDVETELVDWASGKRVFWILLRAFGGAALIYFVLNLVTLLAVVIRAASADDSGFGSSGDDPSFGGFAVFLLVLSVLLPLVWIAIALFLPRLEALSEWQMLLDAKAPLAGMAYQVVQDALRERRVPAWIEPTQRVVNLPERATRHFLRVSLPRYQVIVSVFPFGWDLYMGWTMVRREVPAVVVLRWLKSLVRPHANYDDLIDLEPVRALREAVHNAMRQGIEAADRQHTAPPPIPDAGAELPVQATRVR